MRRRKAGEEYYVVPGGGVEEGETSEEAAVREAKEETGLDIALERKLGVLRDGARTVHYLLAASHRGKLRVGSPERYRRTADNVYELEWVDAERLEKVSLRPAHARRICRGVPSDV